MKNVILLSCLMLSIAADAQRGYVHDAMKDKYGKPGEEQGMDWMNNKMLNVKVDPEYAFQQSVTMHITNYKKGEIKDESDITYFFNTAGNKLGMKSSEERRKKSDDMFIIYDYKANAMIMLNETDKTGMAININAFMSGDAIRRREEGTKKPSGKSNMDCKKTGKTKTIQGYKCFEYVCVNEDEGTRSEMWITTEIPFDLSKTRPHGAMSMYYGAAGGQGGMLIEARFYKHGTLESAMTVTSVDKNANKLVRTNDYKFTRMN